MQPPRLRFTLITPGPDFGSADVVINLGAPGRFHPLFLSEPSGEESLEILYGARQGYEEHHKVSIPDSQLQLAVDLAVRYLPDRRLPDKALDLIDEACALVNLRGNESSPPWPNKVVFPYEYV